MQRFNFVVAVRAQMLQRQLSLVKQAFLPLEIDLGAATHAAFDQSCIISTRQNLPTPVQNYDHSQNSGFNYFDFRHTFNMPARPSRPKGRELDPAKKNVQKSCPVKEYNWEIKSLVRSLVQ